MTRKHQHHIVQVGCMIQIKTSFYTKVTIISYKHNLFLQTHTATKNNGTTIIYHWHGIKTSPKNDSVKKILRTFYNAKSSVAYV
jgi:hypothetical protein